MCQILLVQFALESVQELVAVDNVVWQSDAEGMLSGHVVQQRRPGRHYGGSISTQNLTCGLELKARK